MNNLQIKITDATPIFELYGGVLINVMQSLLIAKNPSGMKN